MKKQLRCSTKMLNSLMNIMEKKLGRWHNINTYSSIFNLKIILYKKQDGKYIQDIRQPLYLDKEDECNNPVEIKLLHTNITNQKQAPANHYESVI